MKKIIVTLAAVSGLLLTGVSASAEECYVLREYNGRIALFTESSDEPLAVYKPPVTPLYPGDAELLREGIRLKTRAEVTRLIAELDLE